MDQAENLRNIIKLQNQRNISNARIIAVTSGKGGVGKSNTSINLALGFKKLGKKVLILDTDFGLANIEVMVGVIPKYNFSDLLLKRMDIKDIITEGPEGIYFISGGSGIAKMVDLDKEQIKRFVSKISELEEYADVIIIDTGAGISPAVMEFLVACPEILLVTTPEPTSITDSYAVLKALCMKETFNKNATTVKLIANKCSSHNDGKLLYDKLNVVVSKFLNINMEYIGNVPYDANISKAVMKQKPISLLYPDSSASKAYEKIVQSLENGNCATQNIGVRNFFKSVFRKR